MQKDNNNIPFTRIVNTIEENKALQNQYDKLKAERGDDSKVFQHMLLDSMKTVNDKFLQKDENTVVNLVILWYKAFKTHKSTIKTFIENGGPSLLVKIIKKFEKSNDICYAVMSVFGALIESSAETGFDFKQYEKRITTEMLENSSKSKLMN